MLKASAFFSRFSGSGAASSWNGGEDSFWHVTHANHTFLVCWRPFTIQNFSFSSERVVFTPAWYNEQWRSVMIKETILLLAGNKIGGSIFRSLNSTSHSKEFVSLILNRKKRCYLLLDELAIRAVEFQRLLGIFPSGAVGKFSAPPLPILCLKVLQ